MSIKFGEVERIQQEREELKERLKIDHDASLKDFATMDDLKFEEIFLNHLGNATSKIWNDVHLAPDFSQDGENKAAPNLCPVN